MGSYALKRLQAYDAKRKADDQEKKTITSAEKKQNVQYQREQGEFARNEGNIPSTSEIQSAVQEKLSKLRSDRQKQDIQRKKDETQFTHEGDVARGGSQVKADTAKKQLQMYLDSDERKEWAGRQQETDKREQALREMADYWQGQADAEHDQDVTRRNLEAIENMSDEDRAAFEKYVSGGTYTDTEAVEAHKGLKSRYSNLDLLKETWERNRDAELNQKAAEGTADMLDSNMDRGLAWVPSVAANIVGGVTGTAGRINEMFNGTGQYRSPAETTLGDLPTTIGQTVQAETTKHILDGKELDLLDGISGAEVGAMAYQGATTLMEIAGQLAVGYFAGSGISSGLMATQTFANSMTEATRQGATAEQAVILSVGKAGLEAVTEKIPLDDLMDIAKKGMKGGGWKALKQVFAQAGSEIAEEEISLFGGLLMEAAVLREKSSYKQNIGDMVANGSSYAEAREQANRSIWNEALQTAAVSGFAGGLSAAGSGYFNSQFVQNGPDGDYLANQGKSDVAQESTVQPQTAPVEGSQEETVTNWESLSTNETAQKLLDGMEAPARKTEPKSKADLELDKILSATVGQKQETGMQMHADDFSNEADAAEQNADSTIVNTDPSVHTEREQAVIDEYQNSVDDNLVEYVKAVKNNPGQKMHRYPLKDVNNRAAQDIQRLTGIDVSGNKTQLEARIVEHILKDHGETGKTDQSMRDINDIGRIQYVIDNYDSIEHGGNSSAYVYQNQHGRNAKAQTVIMKKKVNGTYFVVEAVPDTKKKTVFVTSAYMSKDGTQKTAAPLSGDAEAYRVTSDNATKETAVSNKAESSLAGEAPETGSLATPINPASDNIVSQGAAEVNGNIDEHGAPDSDKQINTSSENRQVKGTGAAEQNFSGVADYENMLYDGNIQRARPGAVRDVEMPKKDSDGRRVTELAGNAVSSGVTPDKMADAIKSLVGDKKLSFDTRTNKRSLENAAEVIKTRGAEAIKSELGEHAKNSTIADGDIEKGLVLYAQYANDPNYQDEASEVFTNLAAIANMSGRNLQMFSLMKRMTPEGQLMTVRKNVSRYIDSVNESRSGRKQITYNPGQQDFDTAKKIAGKRNVVIDEALEQDFINAKTEEQKKAALDNIYKNVAVQIKPTLGEAWDAWRNLAMLGNVKTHERNFFSTAAFQPFVEVKRDIGAALESLLLKQDKRTKSVLVGKDAKALLQFAKEDAKSDAVQQLMAQTGTTGDGAKNAIQDYRKLLPGVLDKVSKANAALMEREDMLFKRSEYARSLASFLKARGYTADQVQNGRVPKGILAEGRQHAIQEARKATFNDQNKLTEAIAKVNKVGEKFGGSVWHTISKGAVPFLRTPANVLVRAGEYNPLALGKTLLTMKSDIDSGKLSGADVVDRISSGLTGTVAMGIGALLASGALPGVKLHGKIEDEDELREGAQEYSVQIGEKYYAIAWLAPAMIPLFIGANLYNNLSHLEDGADGWDVAQAFVDVGSDALDPMLELSMLSSLKDIIDKVKYEESAADMAVTAILNTATSYFTQGLPTIFGQMEQSTEAEKSTTYVNTDNKLERMVKTAVSGATKKVPGVDLYQTTKLDEFGEPAKNDEDWMKRTFDALINPFSVSEQKADPILKEISRLNEAQTENVSPPTASKILSYTGKSGNVHQNVRLTEEQYQTLATTQGQTAKQLISEMIESRQYKAMNDEQKAAVISLAYDYARETGQIAAIPDREGYKSSWMEDAAKVDTARYIMHRVINSDINQAVTDLDTAWDKGYSAEVVERREAELDTAYTTYSDLDKITKQTIRDFATGTTAKYIEARDKGVSHDDFLAAAKKVATVTGTGSNGNVRDIDRREAIANTKGMTESEMDIVMKAYMTDYDPEDESPDKTELKYDYIRQELGLSAAAYAETYRAHLDNSKKKDKIAAIMDLGYDKNTATALYKLYAGQTDVVAWYGGE